MVRPMLFLDVDGVLALKEAAPVGYIEHKLLSIAGDLHTVWLNPKHGPWLNTLADRYEIVWATGWEHDAPRLLGPLLNLPAFPFINFTQRPTVGSKLAKARDVATWAGDRSAAWVDDDFDEDAFTWADRRKSPTLLIQPSPTVGLEERHIETLLRFGVGPESGA